ncbi:hypothetical protein LCGC14_1606260 [marine sediment metagenome]|uniref:Uncharacterized protein n=1 Tax=marine sediment metagenome TaxID=412755 RepID=A0A0F9I9N0_9ZZZZ
MNGGICRCGRELPTVPDTETPYEFCSQQCKDEDEAQNDKA